MKLCFDFEKIFASSSFLHHILRCKVFKNFYGPHLGALIRLEDLQ